MADDLQITEDESILPFKSLLLVNRPPMASDFNWHDFFALSFSHHDEILSKTKTLEERVFYIHQAATLHWDKYTLRDNLKADLFHHQSQMPSNFAKTMPSTRHALKAIKASFIALGLHCLCRVLLLLRHGEYVEVQCHEEKGGGA